MTTTAQMLQELGAFYGDHEDLQRAIRDQKENMLIAAFEEAGPDSDTPSKHVLKSEAIDVLYQMLKAGTLRKTEVEHFVSKADCERLANIFGRLGYVPYGGQELELPRWLQLMFRTVKDVSC